MYLLINGPTTTKWAVSFARYSEYVDTFPEDESERENFSKYATRNTLAGVYRIAAHGKTVSLDDTG